MKCASYVLMIASAIALVTPASLGQLAVDLTVSWSEVNLGTHTPVANPNGILEQGESARISVSIGFPAVGTPVPFGGGTATVAAFAQTEFNLHPSNQAGLNGTWGHLQTSAGFLGELGPITPNGSLPFAWIGQPNPASTSPPIADNPLVGVWNALWTPPTYAPRTAAMSFGIIFDSPAYLFLLNGYDPSGNPIYVGTEWWEFTYGGCSIPIAPAPPVSAAALITLSFAARRRRPRRQPC